MSSKPWRTIVLHVAALLFAAVTFADGGPSIRQVRLGLQSTWKVGYPTWTEVEIESTAADFAGSLIFETVDADGVVTVYSRSIAVKQNQSTTASFVTQHGRSNRPFRVALRDSDGREVTTRNLTDEERGTPLPVGQPWVVGIGRGLNLDQAAMRSAKGLLPSYSSVEISQVEHLPTSPLGWRGVDLVVLSTSDLELLRGISSEQQVALSSWVQHGGELLVTIGKNGAELSSLAWLKELIAADFRSVAQDIDPASVESYLASQKKLGSLTCAEFDIGESNVDLILYSRDRRKLPLLFHHALGLGRVQVFAADLNVQPITDWPDRHLLLSRLLAFHTIDAAREPGKSSRTTSLMGYDDFAGQLKTTLENFREVRSGSLSLVTAIVVGFMLMIGAFDYFVVSRGWRKPGWTWWTLPLWSLIAMAGIFAVSRMSKPDKFIANSIELVDIDTTTGAQRGKAWLHQYSGRSGVMNLSATARRLTTSGDVSTASSELPCDVGWSGHPGRSLGGFESTIRTDFGFPKYNIEVPTDEGSSSRLAGVGISTAGTKSLAVEWGERLLDVKAQPFVASGGSDLLEGTWTNPMQETLVDGLIIYRKWFYRLPTKLRPGASFQITAKDIPKDLVRYLQRRRIVKDLDVGEPWDPNRRDDPLRLTELMMFHRAAGGTEYTGLFHHYLDDLDLSHHLNAKRIIVVGRLEQPIIRWAATHNGESVPVEADRREAFVRFLVPIVD